MQSVPSITRHLHTPSRPPSSNEDHEKLAQESACRVSKRRIVRGKGVDNKESAQHRSWCGSTSNGRDVTGRLRSSATPHWMVRWCYTNILGSGSPAGTVDTHRNRKIGVHMECKRTMQASAEQKNKRIGDAEHLTRKQKQLYTSHGGICITQRGGLGGPKPHVFTSLGTVLRGRTIPIPTHPLTRVGALHSPKRQPRPAQRSR